MKTKTHFTFRVDIWDDAGDSIVEHVAGADDFEWPKRSTGRRWRAGPQPGSPCGRARASYMRTGSADKRMQNPTGAVRGSEDDMRCPGCGAEMHLIEVAPDKTKMVPGYEQHTFECSGCHDHIRQLVFIPRAIEPLNSEEMQLSAAWLENLDKGTVPKGDDSARAVRAASPLKAVYAFGMLTLIVVAGSLIIWGQGLKGPMGDQGPPGPKGPQGDAGPPSTTSGIRIVRSNCDETTCRVQCGENEMLLTAYCGPKRNPAIIPTERAATCRSPVPANDPIVAVCALMASP